MQIHVSELGKSIIGHLDKGDGLSEAKQILGRAATRKLQQFHPTRHLMYAPLESVWKCLPPSCNLQSAAWNQ
jgi:hypothetical protein